MYMKHGSRCLTERGNLGVAGWRGAYNLEVWWLLRDLQEVRRVLHPYAANRCETFPVVLSIVLEAGKNMIG